MDDTSTPDFRKRPPAPGHNTSGAVRAVHVAVAVLAVAGAALLLFALAMRRGINHDEHQFVAGAALLAREGLLPYRNFAWFHMPLLLYIDAALFTFSSHLLLAARMVSIVSAAGMFALLAGVAFFPAIARPEWSRAGTRLALSLSAILLLIASAAFMHASGRAWNHDLPVFLAMAAFLARVRGLNGRRVDWTEHLWSAGAGALLGLAISTRLTFAPLAAPLLIAPWLWPGDWRSRLRDAAPFSLGMLVGLTPAIHAFVIAPDAFFFGNIRYAQLNTAWYRMLQPPVGGVSWPGKIVDAGRFLLQPANLPLIVLTGVAVARAISGRRVPDTHAPHTHTPHTHTLRLWLLLLPFLALGALAPTPMQMQYVYVFFPFLALGLILACTNEPHPAALLRWAFGAAAVAMFFALPAYVAGLSILSTPSAWVPVKVHQRGSEMAALAASSAWLGTASAVQAPSIISLAPIDPLEGGARIEPRLATGPFAWRVAPLLTKAERERYGLVGEEEIGEVFHDDPPRALFAGLKDGAADAEAPLLAWVGERGYVAVPMRDEGTLYLSPLASWSEADGATIRLGAHTLPPTPLLPGDTFAFSLYLQSDGPSRTNLNRLVRGVNAAGEELFRIDGWPWGSATTAWPPDALWPDGHSVTLPTDAKPGLLRIAVSFYDPATLESVGDEATAGWLQIGTDDGPINALARFGETLALLTVDAAATAQAGSAITVELLWAVEETPRADLTIFAHLIPADQTAGNAPPVAQADAPPLAGFAPTSLWPAGLVQADRILLSLPPELTPGEYNLLLGLYDSATQQRLPIDPPAPADALIATTLTITR